MSTVGTDGWLRIGSDRFDWSGDKQGFYDAIATYRSSRDPAAFANILADAVRANQGLNAP